MNEDLVVITEEAIDAMAALLYSQQFGEEAWGKLPDEAKQFCREWARRLLEEARPHLRTLDWMEAYDL